MILFTYLQGLKMLKYLLLLLLLLFLGCASPKSFTTTPDGMQHYTREYTYQASDLDSKVTSRRNALAQVENMLLGEIAKYIKSHEQLTNNNGDEVYTEDIEVFVAGVVQTTLIKEKWNGVSYWVKASMSINRQDVMNKLDAIIKDNRKSTEYREQRSRVDSLMAETKQLRTLLGKTKTKQEKQNLKKSYTKSNEKLLASERFKKGYRADSLELQIEYYSKALRSDSMYGKAYNNRGLAYKGLGEYSNALRDFNRVLTLNDKDDYAYNNRGIVYKLLGNYNTAIDDYSKAISLNPHDSDYYNNRGVAYQAQGSYTLAIRDYSKAVSDNPYYATAYKNRGNTYYNYGNNMLAIRDYNKYISLERDESAKSSIKQIINLVKKLGGEPISSPLLKN